MNLHTKTFCIFNHVQSKTLSWLLSQNTPLLTTNARPTIVQYVTSAPLAPPPPPPPLTIPVANDTFRACVLGCDKIKLICNESGVIF